jgi:transcriptional regulator with XRE-family HTH domain
MAVVIHQRAIGYIIRRQRLELVLTQEELAERIGKESKLQKQADISRIETGAVELPRPERLHPIA